MDVVKTIKRRKRAEILFYPCEVEITYLKAATMTPDERRAADEYSRFICDLAQVENIDQFEKAA